MDRRRMLEASAGAALVSAVAAAPAAMAAPLPPLPSRNALFVRLRGAPRGQPGLWWFNGMLWGKRSLDAAQPLFAVEGFSFS